MPHRFSPQEHLLPHIIAPDMWQQYRGRLHQTLRWQGGDPPANPEFSESVLEHVEDALRLRQEAFTRYPALLQGLNPNVIDNILWAHDGGEIFQGDVPCTDTRVSAEQQALNEWMGVVFCAFPLLESANGIDQHSILAGYLELFEAFESHDLSSPWAREAAFARILDTMQGGTTAMRELYPDPTTENARTSVLKFSLPRVLKPINILLPTLESTPLTRHATRLFVADHIRDVYMPHYSDLVYQVLPNYEHAQDIAQVL